MKKLLSSLLVCSIAAVALAESPFTFKASITGGGVQNTSALKSTWKDSFKSQVDAYNAGLASESSSGASAKKPIKLVDYASTKQEVSKLIGLAVDAGLEYELFPGAYFGLGAYLGADAELADDSTSYLLSTGPELTGKFLVQSNQYLVTTLGGGISSLSSTYTSSTHQVIKGNTNGWFVRMSAGYRFDNFEVGVYGKLAQYKAQEVLASVVKSELVNGLKDTQLSDRYVGVSDPKVKAIVDSLTDAVTVEGDLRQLGFGLYLAVAF